MSSLGMRHPEEGQLLRYLDGELPGRKARQIRKHLEACWHCRAELEELQSTVGDCVRYRKNVLGTCLPPPPDPWQDLSRGFDRIDASLDGESLAARLARAIFLPRPAVRWAVTGGHRGGGGLHHRVSIARDSFGSGGRAVEESGCRGGFPAAARAPHPHQHGIAAIDARHRRRPAGFRCAGHRAAFPLGELQLGRPTQRKGFRNVARPTPGEAGRGRGHGGPAISGPQQLPHPDNHGCQ